MIILTLTWRRGIRGNMSVLTKNTRKYCNILWYYDGACIQNMYKPWHGNCYYIMIAGAI